MKFMCLCDNLMMRSFVKYSVKYCLAIVKSA